MKSYGQKTGFTLVEMVIVVAIIAFLAAMVVGIARRIDNQSKERLCENTFALLDTALEQFRDYGYEYKTSATDDDERDFYLGLDFPADCNGFTESKLEERLGDLLGAESLPDISGGDHNDVGYSGSEALYFFLDRVPASSETLDKIYRPDKGTIVKALITDKDAEGERLKINIDGTVYPLLRIVDPWGKTLRYDYYENKEEDPGLTWLRRERSKRNFPLLISAGPDGIFGNTDDLRSR
jgi:prepilin-type N-terminal cleavage/methylation domain-containing protein